ncbi:MAG: N,N-dimethylformamidase beta subunit family domain-containing protein [Acidimicrobiales bacterium]
MKGGRALGLVAVLGALVAGGPVWGFHAGLTGRATGSGDGATAAGAGGPSRGDRATESAAGAGVGAGDGQVARPVTDPGLVDGIRARWVIDENAKPGTEGWRLGRVAKNGEIEGWLDRVSAQQGDTVGLHVSTTAPTFRVEAYRMGFYGGKGGRLVWQSPTVEGSRQPSARRAEVTNLVDAPWPTSIPVAITGDWPPGDYLFKLIAGPAAGQSGGQLGPERWVPLTVRDDASNAAYVVQNAVTTWQAYNLWGGYDLYEGRTPGGGSSFERRSRVVSFDRPYDLGAGAGDFPGNELPFVSLVESLGLDVTYWTDVDLHERPQLLARHRALFTLGHDEYWSTAMRRGAEDGRDRGVNLGFLGANAVFRHIRFADSQAGPDRHEVAYKSASEDPLRHQDDAEVTVNWREPPLGKPESTLIGQEYECNPVKADMIVGDASAWVYAGTGLHEGDHLKDLVGPEYDRYYASLPGPRNVQILAHSPVRCRTKESYSDMTYYTAPSGAGVFATGTNWWVSHLSAPCADAAACPHDEAVVRITQNVLEAFGRGPAGEAHPSVPSSRSARTDPAGANGAGALSSPGGSR